MKNFAKWLLPFFLSVFILSCSNNPEQSNGISVNLPYAKTVTARAASEQAESLLYDVVFTFEDGDTVTKSGESGQTIELKNIAVGKWNVVCSAYAADDTEKLTVIYKGSVDITVNAGETAAAKITLKYQKSASDEGTKSGETASEDSGDDKETALSDIIAEGNYQNGKITLTDSKVVMKKASDVVSYANDETAAVPVDEALTIDAATDTTLCRGVYKRSLFDARSSLIIGSETNTITIDGKLTNGSIYNNLGFPIFLMENSNGYLELGPNVIIENNQNYSKKTGVLYMTAGNVLLNGVQTISNWNNYYDGTVNDTLPDFVVNGGTITLGSNLDIDGVCYFNTASSVPVIKLASDFGIAEDAANKIIKIVVYKYTDGMQIITLDEGETEISPENLALLEVYDTAGTKYVLNADGTSGTSSAEGGSTTDDTTGGTTGDDSTVGGTTGDDTAGGSGNEGTSGSSESLESRLGQGIMPGTYEINNVTDLMYLCTLSTSKSFEKDSSGNEFIFKLTADIDASSLTLTQGSSSYLSPYNTFWFKGTFDGCGHRIYNMSIAATITNAGLFGYLGKGGVIKNLTVEGDINLSNNVNIAGGIVSQATSNALIDNCVSKVNITGKTTDRAGGICGQIYEDSADIADKPYVEIRNCIYTGAMDIQEYSGGILGYISNKGYAKIINCANYGSINVNGGVYGYCGGILGSFEYIEDNESYIPNILGLKNCVSIGKITTNSSLYCGCLIGITSNPDFPGDVTFVSNIDNCYVTSDSCKITIIPDSQEELAESERSIFENKPITAGTQSYLIKKDGNALEISKFEVDNSQKIISEYSENSDSNSIDYLNLYITNDANLNDATYSVYKQWYSGKISLSPVSGEITVYYPGFVLSAE